MEAEFNVGFVSSLEHRGNWCESKIPMTREKAEEWLQKLRTMWPDAVLLKRDKSDESWQKVDS